MTILHVVQSLDPAWGGIARVLPMLATELVRAGERCRIATLAGGRYGIPPAVADVEVLKYAADDGRLGKSPDFNARINELVVQADVVHLHGLWTAQNWSAGKAARRLRKPYIMTPHSHMMPWSWQRSWWKKRPIGWLFEHGNLRRAARLHALAEGEAAAMRALGFNDRIVVIPNGLHTAEFDPLPDAEPLLKRFPQMKDKRLIVFMSRIHPQKGIVQAMKASFDVGAAAGKDWHLVIAGADELGMIPMVQATLNRKGLRERATFTGLLSRQEVLMLLSRATVLLQPSLSEGLSMSILEALAAAVPVVISTECNMPEVRTKGAGWVVEPRRDAIAAALAEMIKMPATAVKAMGDKGRALARERFDWGVLIPQYRRMYEEVAAGR